MRLSDTLRERFAPLWARVHTHPFVAGLRDGTLPVDRFRFYMAQDYVFLAEYARVLALATAKAHDLETMGRFAGLLGSTLNVEMGLHRAYAARFGLTPGELAATEAAPVTHAYTRHLLAVAYSGSLADIAFALLPCQWGYWELGQELKARGAPGSQPLYEEWVQTYSSPEYGALAGWLRDLADRLAEGLPPADLARLAEHYHASARYELAFWEAAYEAESWSV
jgi:thiaminase/transcriptional activator TenA